MNSWQGWNFLKSGNMKEYPIFLVIDNVQPHEESIEEAREYLSIEYNSRSKIMITSRSRDVVKFLLGDRSYCCEMPCLTREEAAGVFLQQGAPQMDYSSFTKDERRVIDSFLDTAWFPHQGGHFHPLALRAVAAFLRDRSETPNVLSWDNYLPEYKNVKDTTEATQKMFKILGLQFNSLDRMTQLIFLDICIYASKALESSKLSNSTLEDLTAWLADIHGKPIEVVKFKVSFVNSFHRLL